jgi:hypothetical protein
LSRAPDTLFPGYVNAFLKTKIEAAGWPPGVDTDRKRAEYRRLILDREGIELGDVAANPAKKTIAKLCLNSAYGKFGQRDNKTQVKVVDNLRDFDEIARSGVSYE